MKKNVAIIGAGISGLVSAFYLKQSGIDFTVFEKESRIGGVINTKKEKGFLFEKGPNSGVVSNIEVVKLFEDLKNDCQIEYADKTSKKRLIWKNNQWNALPSGLISAVTTPLFTFGDKLRVLVEPFRKKGTNPHENLSDMVKRRLGKSFLEYAIDPFISGIYTGDTEYLIPKYALPKLYSLEQTYGSFIRGAIKKGKEPKSEDEKKITKEIFSVKGGLIELVNALERRIESKNIITNFENLKVEKKDDFYIINNKVYTHIISTVNAPALSSVFPFLKNELIDISNLKYAKVVEATIGFNELKGCDLNAFGGLVPSKEKKDILGILYMSTIFKNRAPQSGALLTVFAGGIKREDITQLGEDDLKDRIKKDVKEMLNLKTFEPDLFKIHYYSHAIAQYGIDSGKRIKAVLNIQKNYPGLILGGSITGGVGIADRVKQARNISDFLK